MSSFAFDETPVSSSKLNQKTLLITTGANINVAPQTCQMAACTATGSGFTKNFVYQRDADNLSWHVVGFLSSSTGAITYWNGTDWTQLAVGTSNQVLKGGVTPSWGGVPVDGVSAQLDSSNNVAQKNGFISVVMGSDQSVSSSTNQIMVMNVPAPTHGFELRAKVNLVANKTSGAGALSIGIQEQAYGVAPAQFDYGWTIMTSRETEAPGGFAVPLTYLSVSHNSDLTVQADGVSATGNFDGTALLDGFVSGSTSSGQLVIYIISGNVNGAMTAKQNSHFYALW